MKIPIKILTGEKANQWYEEHMDKPKQDVVYDDLTFRIGEISTRTIPTSGGNGGSRKSINQ